MIREILREERVRYYRARALIARAAGRFAIAQSCEEDARAIEQGTDHIMLSMRGLQCRNYEFDATTVSVEKALDAIGYQYAGGA